MSGPKVNPFGSLTEGDEDEANMEVDFQEEEKFEPLDFTEPVYDPFEEDWENHVEED
jgi:hypothetical protein